MSMHGSIACMAVLHAWQALDLTLSITAPPAGGRQPGKRRHAHGTLECLQLLRCFFVSSQGHVPWEQRLAVHDCTGGHKPLAAIEQGPRHC